MRIYNYNTLKAWGREYPDTDEPLRVFHSIMKAGSFQTTLEIQQDAFNSIEHVAENNHVVNIGGNKYRLIVKILFETQTVYVLWFGRHKDYGDLTKKMIAAMSP